jgi:hypothetical protein
MRRSLFLFLSVLLLAGCAAKTTATQNPPSGEAIIWERSGGIAGVCQRLRITFEGAYQLEDCAEEATMSAGQLAPEQWDELAVLLDRYAMFQYNFIPPQGSADMFTDSYTFNGSGDERPSPETQLAINERLAAIAAELAAGVPVARR